MHKVFLSHNRGDKPWVRQLNQLLEGAGLDVFFDEDDIPPGVNFAERIDDAIAQSEYLLLVISQTSMASKWVGMEASIASLEDPNAAAGRLIPLIIDPKVKLEKLPGRLRIRNCVDLTNADDREGKLRNVLAQLGVPHADSVVLPAWPEFPPLNTGNADTVRAWGWSFEKLLTEFIRLDLGTLGQVLDLDEGTAAQWAPIFEAYPQTWRMVYDEPQVVAGYWHIAPLFRTEFDVALRGELRDGAITRNQVPILLPDTTYDVYFVQICLLSPYRRTATSSQLFASIFEAMQDLTRDRIRVGELCANAFTAEGEAVCRSFNMTSVGRHAVHGTIYRATMADVLRTPFAQRYPELLAAYR